MSACHQLCGIEPTATCHSAAEWIAVCIHSAGLRHLWFRNVALDGAVADWMSIGQSACMA